MEMKCERGREYPQNVQMPMDKKCKMKWKLKKILKNFSTISFGNKNHKLLVSTGYFFGICFWNFFLTDITNLTRAKYPQRNCLLGGEESMVTAALSHSTL